MADSIKIKVILGSTRQNRFSERPGQWIAEFAKQKPGVEVEILDLRDYPLPFFDDPVPPSATEGPHPNAMVEKWRQKIDDGDAFIIVTPEYNHGYSGVLKNAIDYVFKPWHNKTVGFIGYGSVLGGRVIEQLREVSVELQMAPIRNAIHIQHDVYKAASAAGASASGGNDKASLAEIFKPMEASAEKFLTQLLWWAKALKEARAKGE